LGNDIDQLLTEAAENVADARKEAADVRQQAEGVRADECAVDEVDRRYVGLAECRTDGGEPLAEFRRPGGWV
jgi:hypothetical protein